MEKIIKKRDVEIDLVKGLAIILMVIGHTETPAQNFIYLFHMAVFFMSSGYFHKDRVSEDIPSVLQFVIRKIKGLWLPYALWTAIYSILHNVFIDWNIYTANPQILEGVEAPYATVTAYWTWKDILVNMIKGQNIRYTSAVGSAMPFMERRLSPRPGSITRMRRPVPKRRYSMGHPSRSNMPNFSLYSMAVPLIR